MNIKYKLKRTFKLLSLSVLLIFAVSIIKAKGRVPMNDDLLKKADKLAKDYWGKDGIKKKKIIDNYKSMEKNMEILELQLSSVNDTYEKIYIKSVTPLNLGNISKTINYLKAFGVKVYNPISEIAGRPFFHYSIVLNIKNDHVNYLESDQEVLKFISDLSCNIDDQKDIKNIISLFGLLRGYEICENPVKDLNYYWKFTNYAKEPTEWDYSDEKWIKKDWVYLVKKAENKWLVSVTFLVDPYIFSYLRYKLKISKKGKIDIISLKGAAKSWYE